MFLRNKVFLIIIVIFFSSVLFINCNKDPLSIEDLTLTDDGIILSCGYLVPITDDPNVTYYIESGTDPHGHNYKLEFLYIDRDYHGKLRGYFVKVKDRVLVYGNPLIDLYVHPFEYEPKAIDPLFVLPISLSFFSKINDLKIYYSVDGSDPTYDSKLYLDSQYGIPIEKNTTLKYFYTLENGYWSYARGLQSDTKSLQINEFPLKKISSINITTGNALALTSDGDYLWYYEDQSRLVKIDKNSIIQKMINISSLRNIEDIVFTEDGFWVCEYFQTPYIYFINFDGTISDTLNTDDITGPLAWDGTNLWVLQGRFISQIDVQTKLLTKLNLDLISDLDIRFSDDYSYGLTYDGKYIWLIYWDLYHHNLPILFKIDKNGTILNKIIINYEFFTLGNTIFTSITYGKDRFWIIDSNKILELTYR